MTHPGKITIVGHQVTNTHGTTYTRRPYLLASSRTKRLCPDCKGRGGRGTVSIPCPRCNTTGRIPLA